MFAVVLLTTWNRPRLLQQSLPLICSECEANSWQLVIADDHSSDDEAISLLKQATAAGAILWRREYQRIESQDPHELMQLNNLFAIRRITEKWPDVPCILKIDDDIVCIPGAFGLMRAGWQRAQADFDSKILEAVSIPVT